MKLRLRESQIRQYADRYKIPQVELELINLSGPVADQGFLTKNQLRLMTRWKAPRSAGHVEKNSDGYIREITAFVLQAKEERARIETLTILDGVSWPTASVILHFFHQAPYPILDFRALWSASLKVPSLYSFPFWWKYVEICRSITQRNKVDMRTLDRALWQYSKTNQGKS